MADLGGGMHPPHQPKTNDFGGKISLHFGVHPPPTSLNLTISAEKSVSISVKTFFFLETTWFWAEKSSNFRFRPKNQSQFRWRPFFLFYFIFFGDHLILGGKNVRISGFGRKIRLHFSEDIRIFEVLCLIKVLCLKSPHQNFLDPPLVVEWNFYT